MATSTASSESNPRPPAPDNGDAPVQRGRTDPSFALFWAAFMVLTFAAGLFFMFRAALQM